MCVSAAITAAAAFLSVREARMARKDANSARRRAETQQQEAEATAAMTANNRLAQRRRALSSQSLVTGAGSDVASTGLASAGRATLGGG